MLISILNVVGGFAVLLICADLVVRGAVAIADRLKIPRIVVGLTVVAFGTSAPELFISAEAVLVNLPEVALGNVVGSNIANVLLVVGLPAIISPIMVKQPMVRRNLTMMLAASAAMIWLGLSGTYTFQHGMYLFGGLALYLAYTAVRALSGSGNIDPTVAELTELEDLNLPKTLGVAIAYAVIGLVGLPIGAHFLVEGAVFIADAVGVPKAVISITLIAFGTSLPELATAIAGAVRRHSDVVIGNVLGSNLFNILGVLGVASMIGDIDVASQFIQFDFWIMAASALVLAPFIYGRVNISRTWGAVLFLAYAGYVLVLFSGINY